MVVDSSAIVAIALLEPGWEALAEKAIQAHAIIAAPTVLESHMVLRSRLGDSSSATLTLILRDLDIQVVPFTIEHSNAACAAFDAFGKGRHPAALNFGDCVSFSLAKCSGQPLLYVGNDFSRTDLITA